MTKHDSNLKAGEAKRLAAKAEKWFACDDGRKAMEDAFQLAESTSTRLATERIVDIEIIKIPLSI
jgi:hypothetical protein